jgi:hypothetical protein
MLDVPKSPPPLPPPGVPGEGERLVVASSDRSRIEAFEKEFRRAKLLSDGAIAQVDDATQHARLNPRQNSMAVVMQHVAGNLVSRFTDFLTSDGEKPTRDREGEFADRQLSRQELMAMWERGWATLFQSLAALSDADLDRTVTIRNEPHSVLLALIRSCAHCNWHAAQLAMIAKHFVGDSWKYLTIPPGGSSAFNARMGVK